MSEFDRNRIKDGWEKLCTTNKQTNRHYENNGHLAVNQKCFYIFRPYCSTTYLDAAYCYRRSSVCPSVCLPVALHDHEPCWTHRDVVWDVGSGAPNEPCIRWGAQCRQLANTTEPSMRGGDAAFCQITLTTYYLCHFVLLIFMLFFFSLPVMVNKIVYYILRES